MSIDDAMAVPLAAAQQAGLDTDGVELIRAAENSIYRLTHGVVARVARVGQDAAAVKEVNVARWLEDSEVSAVRVLREVEQPVHVDGHAVTFWHELPSHKHGTTADVGAMLRQLHRLPPPTSFDLPPLNPFVRLATRVDGAVTLTEGDRAWMREHLARLEQRYRELPQGLPRSVVHGDAWVGNVAVTQDGTTILLDFERCSVGPPEWDLIHSAIRVLSFGEAPAEEYAQFVELYGHDVTAWSGFTTLRDIREFRMTCMAAQVAVENPAVHEQAVHRLACLRGQRGPRPWSGWRSVP